jgi:hypothetical protein
MIVSILLAGENRRIEMAHIVDNVNGNEKLDSAPTEIAGTGRGQTNERVNRRACLSHMAGAARAIWLLGAGLASGRGAVAESSILTGYDLSSQNRQWGSVGEAVSADL